MTLIEVATGHFPFYVGLAERARIKPGPSMSHGEDVALALVELWEAINNDIEPNLDPNYFSGDFVDFLTKCLRKHEPDRADLSMLLVRLLLIDPLSSLQDHPFVTGSHPTFLAQWLESVSSEARVPSNNLNGF